MLDEMHSNGNILMKTCKGPCGQEYPATVEFWYRQKKKNGEYALESRCKNCKKEYHNQRYADPETRRRQMEYQKQCYADPEKRKSMAEKKKQRYSANIELKQRKQEYDKQRYARIKNNADFQERRREYDKRRYIDPERRKSMIEAQRRYEARPDVKQRRQEYYKQNIEQIKEYDKKRYAKKKGETGNNNIIIDIDHDVYRLRDPRDKNVFYVGMSKNVHKRYKKHLACAGLNFKLNLRIQEILQCGLVPELELIEQAIPNSAQARERERFWINYHARQGDQLTNIAEMDEAE